MAITTGMYQQKASTPNLLEAYGRGLNLRQMINRGKQNEINTENQNKLREIMSGALRSGKLESIYEPETLSNIAKFSPETAMNLMQRKSQQELLTQRQKENMEMKKANIDYRNKMLELKKEEIGGFEKRKFKQESIKRQVKLYEDQVSNIPKLQEQIDNIDDIVENIISFEREGSGTGPVKEWTTSNPFLNKKAETLDRKFKGYSLGVMMKMFEGKAKAIDSDSERRYFNLSQPNIGNRPETNIDIALGAKSLAIKYRAEIAAKQKWVSDNGDLQGYRSPVIGKLTTIVSPNGKMILIDKSKLNKAKKQGYMSVDEYSKKIFKRKNEKSINKYKAGTILRVRGQKMRIGADGNTLVPIR